METLIGILLFLGAIQPGEYTQSEIDAIEDNHEIQIQEVQNDPVELDQSLELYEDHGDKILILEELW